MDNVAIFADVQNIYYTVKEKYHSHFDYAAFFNKVTSGRQLVKAIAYATDRGDDRQIRFQNILREIGFEVKLTPFIRRADGSAKGDWDVGIALDMAEYAHQAVGIELLDLPRLRGLDFPVHNWIGHFALPPCL